MHGLYLWLLVAATYCAIAACAELGIGGSNPCLGDWGSCCQGTAGRRFGSGGARQVK